MGRKRTEISTKTADQSTTTSPYSVRLRLWDASEKYRYVSTPADPIPTDNMPAERPNRLASAVASPVIGRAP